MNALAILGVRGLATVQDGGRPGHMHEGVPPGGAAVPALLARANRAVGNPDAAAAIEVFGAIDVALRAPTPRALSVDGDLREAAPGDAIACAPGPGRRVAYVAVEGGIDVPLVLGGRGTLLVARLGGHEGRALARGDRLVLGAAGPPRADLGAAPARGGREAATPSADLDLARPLRVVPGPDGARFADGALELLFASTFRVSARGDRTGLRLEGPPLPRRDLDDGTSTPMVAGAIEVPAAGELIVLGPDHPTTGGYPVLAVVATEDLGLLYARKPGADVRFAARSPSRTSAPTAR